MLRFGGRLRPTGRQLEALDCLAEATECGRAPETVSSDSGSGPWATALHPTQQGPWLARYWASNPSAVPARFQEPCADPPDPPTRHGRGTVAAPSQSAASSTQVSQLLARRAGLGRGPLTASQQGEVDSKPCSSESLGPRRRSRPRGLLRGPSLLSDRQRRMEDTSCASSMPALAN